MLSPPGLILPAGSRFHHVGVACRTLGEGEAGLRALGYEPAGAEFADAGLGVMGRFMEGPGPRLELLAPLEGSAVLDPWLDRGSRMYHLAYEVGDLDAAVTGAVQADARQVTAPTPAVAFDGRRICFLMLAIRLLVELIELP